MVISKNSGNLLPYFKLNYLYRDAGNYKRFGSVVFTNIHGMSISYFVALTKLILIDGIYFDPLILGIKPLHFDNYIPELDHSWHELEKVSLTNESPTINMDVSDFISSAIKSRSYQNSLTIETEFTY